MMGMRLDQAIWVLTANTLDGLAPSIIDRLMIAYIDEPTRDQLHTIVQGTYTRTKERFNRVFAGTLNEAAVNHLLEMNPRKVRKILEIALGFAQAEKANELSVEYIKKANCV
jgi:hypothetical protein